MFDQFLNSFQIQNPLLIRLYPSRRSRWEPQAFDRGSWEVNGWSSSSIRQSLSVFFHRRNPPWPSTGPSITVAQSRTIEFCVRIFEFPDVISNEESYLHHNNKFRHVVGWFPRFLSKNSCRCTRKHIGYIVATSSKLLRPHRLIAPEAGVRKNHCGSFRHGL